MVRVGNAAVTIIQGQVVFTTSDARFKTNIKEDVKGLEFINKLRPVVYNFEARKFDEFVTGDNVNKDELQNLDYTDAERIRYSGFIAQEVEALFPDLVHEGSADEATGHRMKSLSYERFGVLAIAAIHELKADYDARLDALERKLATRGEKS